jgi:hypothetical protein
MSGTILLPVTPVSHDSLAVTLSGHDMEDSTVTPVCHDSETPTVTPASHDSESLPVTPVCHDSDTSTVTPASHKDDWVDRMLILGSMPTDDDIVVDHWELIMTVKRVAIGLSGDDVRLNFKLSGTGMNVILEVTAINRRKAVSRGSIPCLRRAGVTEDRSFTVSSKTMISSLSVFKGGSCVDISIIREMEVIVVKEIRPEWTGRIFIPFLRAKQIDKEWELEAAEKAAAVPPKKGAEAGLGTNLLPITPASHDTEPPIHIPPAGNFPPVKSAPKWPRRSRKSFSCSHKDKEARLVCEKCKAHRQEEARERQRFRRARLELGILTPVQLHRFIHAHSPGTPEYRFLQGQGPITTEERKRWGLGPETQADLDFWKIHTAEEKIAHRRVVDRTRQQKYRANRPKVRKPRMRPEGESDTLSNWLEKP